MVEKGISLEIIVKEIFLSVLKLNMNSEKNSFIAQKLAEIEYNLSISCDEKIQLMNLVSVFIELRQKFK